MRQHVPFVCMCVVIIEHVHARDSVRTSLVGQGQSCDLFVPLNLYIHISRWRGKSDENSTTPFFCLLFGIQEDTSLVFVWSGLDIQGA